MSSAAVGRIPRDPTDDCAGTMAQRRRAMLTPLTGAPFDPALARGNVENLIGVAKVPIGIAGPARTSRPIRA